MKKENKPDHETSSGEIQTEARKGDFIVRRKFRIRTSMSNDQKDVLMKFFKGGIHYPKREDRIKLGAETGANYSDNFYGI